MPDNDILTTLKQIETKLTNAGIVSASAEAGLILSEMLNCKPLDLQFSTIKLTQTQLKTLENIVSRREQHEPLQYIFGKAWFMNLCLKVGPGVLIPRPETELAVELICQKAKQGGMVCDLGSGSGAIALSIAYERPDLQVTAIELSNAALPYIEENRNQYKLNNVEIIKSDLFAEVPAKRFDWIAANLPYVTEAEYQALPKDVLNHEPESALAAGIDGFDVIRKALEQIPEHLNPGGKVIFEIGEEQGKAGVELFKATGFFDKIEIMQDLTGRDRFITASSIT